MKMTGRTVLITGGTSGIGLELARQLRTVEHLHGIRSDVGDPASIGDLYEAVACRFPALDTLVNNAGAMRNIKLNLHRELIDLTAEIDVNLKGTMWMVHQFLPLLRKQNNSVIVIVSSGLAFVPFPIAPIYSASKAATHAYTKCLRAQLEGEGVSVVELAPPGTETPLFRAEFADEMKGEKGMPVDTRRATCYLGHRSRETRDPSRRQQCVENRQSSRAALHVQADD